MALFKQFSTPSRWLIYGLIGLVVVIGIVSVLARFMIDSKRLTALVTQTAQAEIGRSLQIKGPVSLSLFPQISVVAHDVRLGNPDWAADQAMLRADKVSFALDWLALFGSRFVIKQVTLDDADLNLQVAPEGKGVAGNWVMASDQKAVTTPGSGSDGTLGFDLHAAQLSKLRISIKDAGGETQQSVMIEKMQGSITKDAISLTGQIRWEDQPLSMMGQVKMDSPKSPSIALKISADKLDISKATKPKPAAPMTVVNHRWVFDTQPLGLDVLPLISASLALDVGALTLPNGVLLPDVSLQLTTTPDQAGVLNLTKFQSGLGGGTLVADAQISGYTSAKPTFQARGHAHGLTLEKIAEQMQHGKASSLVHGGPSELAFHLNAQGNSLRQLVSSMDGQAQISVGAATISSALVDESGDFLMDVLNRINPLSKQTKEAQLDCAVAYLPVNAGLLSIRKSVGVETKQLNLVLDGQVNLRTEELGIKIYPTQRSGLTTGVNAAGLVQINGTLMRPTIGMNRSGFVGQAATVGLAVVTGGISLAAQNAVGIANRNGACQNILHPWSTVDNNLTSH